uniref:V-type proton ATPase subunit a n=1 Tax=Rhodnius prolixus TaxID=13249 RepID=T1HAZ2_RHOPR
MSAFQRKFVSEVRRCEEVERKLRYIAAEVKKDDVCIPELQEIPEAPNPRELIDLEAQVERTENEIQELSHNATNLRSNFVELTELRNVLEKTDAFFQERKVHQILSANVTCGSQIPLTNVISYFRRWMKKIELKKRKLGMCRKSRIRRINPLNAANGLRRLVFGQCLLVLAPLVHRFCFLQSVCFQQQEGESVSRALIGDEPSSRTQLGFVAGVVPRERVFSFERMLWRISRGNVFLRRADIEEPLLDPTTGKLLVKTVFVAFYQGEQLKTRVKKVCSGFHATLYPCPCTLAERNTMVTEVKTRLEDLNMVLNQTDDHRQRVLVTVAREIPKWTVMIRKMKAIYHTMNMFNMDVTKKCLIGECWVPTRDLGTVNRALADGGIWNIFFAGRYIVLMMGLFSMYTGFIYNDIFSRSLNIFGSSWKINYNTSTVFTNEMLQLDPATDDYNKKPYPFGIDPVWQTLSQSCLYSSGISTPGIVPNSFVPLHGCHDVYEVRHVRRRKP